MSVHTLFLELFSEEIPARMQIAAASSLFDQVLAAVSNITKTNLKGEYFVSPRHMGFFVYNIPEDLPPIIDEVRGPRVDAMQSAIDGFLKKYEKKSVNELEIRGKFYYLIQLREKPDIITELTNIVQNALKALVWPKSMRWRMYDLKWVRPLHSIICMLDNKIIPVKFGHLASGITTYGHRFMSPASIEILDCNDYPKQMISSYVKIFPQERKEIIMSGLDKIAHTIGLKLMQDDALLEEVVGLVEWPVVLVAKIEDKFMHLPKEVLVTAMRNHQRYFVFEDEGGNIAPYFGIVSNIETDDANKAIIEGNQRVLRARLSDADFFFQHDIKRSLISRLDDLKRLTFHAEIGSMYDKALSVESIAVGIASQLGLDTNIISRAAKLAKADLTTEMVKEFPELQGIMGYYYALHDGESLEIASSIKEHYRPRGPSDDVPTNSISIVLAIADKLDTLNHMFSRNIKPTGSKDPYALRRSALGILKILDTNNIVSLDLVAINIRDDVQQFIARKSESY